MVCGWMKLLGVVCVWSSIIMSYNSCHSYDLFTIRQNSLLCVRIEFIVFCMERTCVFTVIQTTEEKKKWGKKMYDCQYRVGWLSWWYGKKTHWLLYNTDDELIDWLIRYPMPTVQRHSTFWPRNASDLPNRTPSLWRQQPWPSCSVQPWPSVWLLWSLPS